ncbi:MAG: DUF2726 domain-containing protein [Oceanisphaera sp.]
MSLITMFFILLMFIVLFFIKLRIDAQSDSAKKNHPYRRLNAIFTPAERSFFGVLSQAVDDEALIFGKVRVADVLTPQRSTVKGVWQTAFNKISAKHFDFVLCRKDDLTFLCAIELDDRSHNNAKRQLRDVFLEQACESATFPLIRFPAKSAYKVSDVREAVSAFLISDQTAGAASTLSVEPRTSSEANKLNTIDQADSNFALQAAHKKVCPKCTSEMKLRVAKKGDSVGNKFWGCTAFPKCRHVESLAI